MHGRQNFLPMDIDKAALWKQKPLGLSIVLQLLLWQPEMNSLGSDWHTSPLFIPCPEYSKYVLCPPQPLTWPLTVPITPSFPLCACSPTASQSLESSRFGTTHPKSQEMVRSVHLPQLRERHTLFSHSGLVSQPAHVDQAPTERIAACPAPSGGLQAQTVADMPHFSLGVSAPKVWPLGLGEGNLRSSSFKMTICKIG